MKLIRVLLQKICQPTIPKNIWMFPETRHSYFLALIKKILNKNEILGAWYQSTGVKIYVVTLYQDTHYDNMILDNLP